MNVSSCYGIIPDYEIYGKLYYFYYHTYFIEDIMENLSFSIFQTRIATPEHVPPIPATGATAAWMPKDAGQILGISICSPDVLQGRPLLVGTKSSGSSVKYTFGNKKSPHGRFRKGLFFMEPAKRLELLAC